MAIVDYLMVFFWISVDMHLMLQKNILPPYSG